MTAYKMNELKDSELIEYLDQFVSKEIKRNDNNTSDLSYCVGITDSNTEIMINEKELEKLQDKEETLIKYEYSRNDKYVTAVFYDFACDDLY